MLKINSSHRTAALDPTPTNLVSLSIAYLHSFCIRAHLSLFQRFLDHLKAHDEYFTVTIRLNENLIKCRQVWSSFVKMSIPVKMSSVVPAHSTETFPHECYSSFLSCLLAAGCADPSRFFSLNSWGPFILECKKKGLVSLR